MKLHRFLAVGRRARERRQLLTDCLAFISELLRSGRLGPDGGNSDTDADVAERLVNRGRQLGG